MLRRWLTPKEQLDAKKTQALVRGVIELRQAQLDAVVAMDLEDELKAGLRNAALLTQLLRVLVVDVGAFRSEALDVDTWYQIFGHFAHWIHFDRLDYYQTVRAEERDLLQDTLTGMPYTLQTAILDRWPSRIDHPSGERSELFEALTTKIKAELERATSEQLLHAFESPNGIEAFWAIDLHVNGKAVLFSPESRFHQDSVFRDRLRMISQRSNTDKEIQRNFLTYFRMLHHGAYEAGGSFPSAECRQLLQDTDLLRLIWSAAIAQPLNPRIAGSLRRDRNNLLTLGTPPDLLPTPQWWQLLEEEFFDPEDSNPADSSVFVTDNAPEETTPGGVRSATEEPLC